MSKDYYNILGVSKTSSQEEIKKAYMDSVKKYHPDKNPGNKEYEEKFKEINEAYETLKDSGKRKQYDSYGSDYAHGNYNNYQQYSNMNSDFDFESIFKNFGFGFDNEDLGRTQRKSQASDLQYNLEINLEDAYFGAEKSIQIPTQEVCKSCKGSGAESGHLNTCSKCNGSGKLKRVVDSLFGRMMSVTVCEYCQGTGKTISKKCAICKGLGTIKDKKILNVKIPKGVSNGTVLRLQGEGFSDSRHKGDLYIKLNLRSHPYFKLENYDLYSTEHIDLNTALFGDEIEVKTIKGKAKLKIPSSTQSHTTFKLKGLGMPSLKDSLGNQYVKVIVDIPELTKEQKELFLKAFNKEPKSKKKKKGFWK
jgi:molecular chaperone DnaJ